MSAPAQAGSNKHSYIRWSRMLDVSSRHIATRSLCPDNWCSSAHSSFTARDRTGAIGDATSRAVTGHRSLLSEETSLYAFRDALSMASRTISMYFRVASASAE